MSKRSERQAGKTLLRCAPVRLMSAVAEGEAVPEKVLVERAGYLIDIAAKLTEGFLAAHWNQADMDLLLADGQPSFAWKAMGQTFGWPSLAKLTSYAPSRVGHMALEAAGRTLRSSDFRRKILASLIAGTDAPPKADAVSLRGLGRALANHKEREGKDVTSLFELEPKPPKVARQALLAAISILGLAVTRIRDYSVERRYPVAGVYACEYEDETPDGAQTIKARASLHQRGLRVWGTTTDVSDGRSWNIEARVAHGRLSGTYTAEDPNDDSVGGLFLNIVGRGQLEGLWTGFDTRNKKISSGAYMFSRTRDDVVVRKMCPTDTDETLSLLGESLGRRYITREELVTYAEDSQGRFALVAIVKGRLVAALTAEVLSPEQFLETLPKDREPDVRTMLRGLEFHRIGLIKSVAVSRRVRRQGVGTRIVAAAQAECWRRGTTTLLSIGWTDADGCHIGGVLAGLGFTDLGHFSHFWLEDSTAKGYECPTCGHPCKCDAWLFALQKSDLLTTGAAQVGARSPTARWRPGWKA